MKKISRFFLQAVLLWAVCISAEEVSWNTAEGFRQWKNPHNAVVKVNEGNLMFSEIKPDCWIFSPRLNLNPQNFNRISLRYRARNTERKPGQIFFAHADGNFVGRKRWDIPILKADGQWHTVTLTEKNLRDKKSWFGQGKITALRLDPTDGAGGEIEFAEIRLWQYLLPGQKNETLIWNADNRFGNFKAMANVKVKFENGVLVLSEIKPDCQLICRPLAMNPHMYNRFSFRYRATKVGNLSGELFFAHEDRYFYGKKVWRIPRLCSDGQWHTIVLTPKDIAHPELWFEKGTISGLRFDPTNSAGEKIEISEIKFFFEK